MPDAVLGQHFGHHGQFAQRHRGATWAFTRLQMPIDELYCLYADPGVHPENPGGLMGSIGMAPTDYSGWRITDLAARLAANIVRGTAQLRNPALARVIAFRDQGLDFIRSRDEPMAFSRLQGVWFVREGTHRSIAAALLGTVTLDGIDFESGRLT